MNAQEQAQAFFDGSKDLSTEDRREAVKQLPKDVQEAYWALRKASYFVPEHANLERRKEHLSPSGRYKLVVTPFSTGTGSWNYTQGLVFKVGSDDPIAEVQRNYSSFPFAFVEGHPNGHDYLVCGADYQGQTVVELDTGKRKDHLPKEAAEGVGFCWASYRYVTSMRALLVDGCYWACPYEYRFYDFSDPMNGWPQIQPVDGEGENAWVEADRREPEISEDGQTVKVFQTEYDEDADDEVLQPVAAFTVYRRDGLKLLLTEAWVSEKETDRRQKNKEAQERYEQWLTTYRETDPLYLALLEGLKDPCFESASKYISTGQTYSGWCPTFEGSERRVCKNIITGKLFSAEIDLAVDKGPVKLSAYRDGKSLPAEFFPHSAEGVRQALARAKVLKGGVS